VRPVVPLSAVEETLKLSFITEEPDVLAYALTPFCFVSVTGPVPLAALIVFALISDNGQVPPC